MPLLNWGVYRVSLLRGGRAAWLLLLPCLFAGCFGPSGRPDLASIPIPGAAPVVSYAPSMAGSTISTVAGGGVGDGGPAVRASLYTPQAVAVDHDGNLYIADTGHHRIRRVDAKTGVITTVAGNGVRGAYGDHGEALKAHFSSPHGLAFNANGELFIADTENQRIRMLHDGIIHPIYGKVSMTADHMMSMEGHNHALMYMAAPGSNEQQLAPPHHLAIGPNGNIYVSEMENNRIVKINRSTKELTVIAGAVTAPGFAGDGGAAVEASLMNPHGVAVDGAGNVYIADTLNHRIRRVDGATGVITTIAGNGSLGYGGDGGPAADARLAGPSGVAIAPDGGLYIADTDNRRIRKLTPSESGPGWIISTVGGDGRRGKGGDGEAADSASFVRPIAVTVDDRGNLYVTDAGAQKIRKIDPSGIITTVAGNGRCCDTGDGQAATNADLTPPSSVAVDQAGDLYIADQANHRIRRVDRASGVIVTVAGNGLRGYSGDGKKAVSASLSGPTSVAVGPDGSLYIADQGNHAIRKVDGRTTLISTVVFRYQVTVGQEKRPTLVHLNAPTTVIVDGEGNLYISDTGNQRVLIVIAETGLIATIAGTGTYGLGGEGVAATESDLANPTGLALDEQGNLYIADTDNHRIRRVEMKTGRISTVAGDARLTQIGDGGPATDAGLRDPLGIAINQDTLYIADTGHHLIRMVSLQSGIITSMAGNGYPGFGGDGGPVSDAILASPRGIAVSGAAIYIADTDNRLIRMVTPGAVRAVKSEE